MRGNTIRLRALYLSLVGMPGLAFAQADLAGTAYKEVCAVCHGDKGQGTSEKGPALKGSPFVKSASHDDLQALIKFGRTGKDKRYPAIKEGMPGQSLSEAEMAAIIPYVQVELQK